MPGPTSTPTRDRKILANIQLVRAIARDYRRRSMPDLDDLIQEGTLGLIRAVDDYDPTSGIPFGMFARIWIRFSMCHLIARAWSTPDRGSGIDFDRFAGRDNGPDPLADEIWDAIASLPPEDQPIIVKLFGLGGSPPAPRKTVAAETGRSERAIRKTTRRALAASRIRMFA